MGWVLDSGFTGYLLLHDDLRTGTYFVGSKEGCPLFSFLVCNLSKGNGHGKTKQELHRRWFSGLIK